MLSLTRARIHEHITATLGPIVGEWTERTDGTGLPFSIVKVIDCPVKDAFCMVTVGLSEHELRFPSGASARQELLFSCHSRYESLNVQGLLGAVALDIVAGNEALARGAVLGPSGPVLPGLRLEALYASLPAYMPERFAFCGATSPRTHFMWLVPISVNEANFVAQRGWDSFEKQLVKQDPDLLDLDRQEIRFPNLRMEIV